VKACSDSIKDIETSLGDLAKAISTTASGYRLTDSTNIEQALEIERELYES
jgi:acetaldehyde dehydrogenase (acetylating)